MPFVPRESARGDLDLFFRKVLIVIAAGIALGMLWAAREVVILVFIAAVLAAGITPAVQRVRIWVRLWFHRRISRGAAVLLVYLPFLCLAAVVVFVLIPQMILDGRALAAQLPALIERNILTPLSKWMPVGPARAWLRSGIHVPSASVLFYARSTVTAFASVIAILFMVVYMLIDAQRLRNLILLLFPAEDRGRRRAMLTRIGRRLSSWLVGQAILSGIIGCALFVGLLALRIPYALPLAIFATLGEMVPILGPIIGTTPALIIALLHSRWQFWSLLVVAALLQKAENLFIAPRVMSRKVSISPLAVFIAFLLGGSLLGIVGAVMAIPLAVIAQVTFDEVFVARRERRRDVDRTGTLRRRVS
jgi:predicted PurR-regulated permease PerM